MARLHEYQSKGLLHEGGIAIPAGQPAHTPDEARAIAAEIGRSVVIKAQAWVTGRASYGAVKFADTPDEAESAGIVDPGDDRVIYLVENAGNRNKEGRPYLGHIFNYGICAFHKTCGGTQTCECMEFTQAKAVCPGQQRKRPVVFVKL